MDDQANARLRASPAFLELQRSRGALGRGLTIAILVIYFGFVGLVAFAPGTMGRPVWGAMTLGFPLGLGVILSAIVLTGLYVLRGQRYVRLADTACGGGGAMRRLALAGAAIAFSAGGACAADLAAAPAARQPTDPVAIVLFAGFVLLTLGITAWAARRTRTASDFYAAGGSITGFQNGVAISGDFMSAASFLGISAMVYAVASTGCCIPSASWSDGRSSCF